MRLPLRLPDRPIILKKMRERNADRIITQRGRRGYVMVRTSTAHSWKAGRNPIAGLRLLEMARRQDQSFQLISDCFPPVGPERHPCVWFAPPIYSGASRSDFVARLTLLAIRQGSEWS